MSDLVKFEVPERCLLRQALLWVSRRLPPIPDDAFSAAPDDLVDSDFEGANPLIRLLRMGKLDVVGRLHVYIAVGEGFVFLRQIDGEGFSGIRFQPRAGSLTKETVDLSQSKVDVTSEILNPLIHKEIFSEIDMRMPDDKPYYLLKAFCEEATVPTNVLFGLFPDDLNSTAHHLLATEPAAQGKTMVAAEKRCEEWLVGLMKCGKPEKPKSRYFEQAKEELGAGRRGFDRAWAAAVQRSSNPGWSKPGRKS